jgi:hypothetical protein
MSEAVRFFWLRGDAALPLSAIPEEERAPIRVRRSVAQRHVPEVVKQLEANRFVAAAWPAGACATMILCHPNVVKGPGDGLILDTRSLPWVNLRLPERSDAQQTARLFLAAFGSEAVTAEECLAARHRLVGWLEGHNQPEMAATVRRLMKFPIGFRADALDVINSWRQVLVKGHKARLDRYLGEVDKRFAGFGWSRDQKFEDELNRTPHQINRFHCWVSGESTFPRVMLCLNRATDRRVRGGTYGLLDDGTSLLELASEIQRVLGEVLEPAAAETGLQVFYPRVGPISRVGSRTQTAMDDLAKAGDGQWPLPEDAEALWRKFVFTACREDAAFRPEELHDWFLASGWEETAASELTKRFYRDVALIDEYEEDGRQPA